jgi:hypothetical protein
MAALAPRANPAQPSLPKCVRGFFYLDLMKSPSRKTSIETRCTPVARQYLNLFTGEPLFEAMVHELAKMVGVLSQFDIERAVVAVKKTKAKRRW